MLADMFMMFSAARMTTSEAEATTEVVAFKSCTAVQADASSIEEPAPITLVTCITGPLSPVKTDTQATKVKIDPRRPSVRHCGSFEAFPGGLEDFLFGSAFAFGC